MWRGAVRPRCSNSCTDNCWVCFSVHTPLVKWQNWAAATAHFSFCYTSLTHLCLSSPSGPACVTCQSICMLATHFASVLHLWAETLQSAQLSRALCGGKSAPVWNHNYWLCRGEWKPPQRANVVAGESIISRAEVRMILIAEQFRCFPPTDGQIGYLKSCALALRQPLAGPRQN